jgi:L-ascorbate metabolism protein UlaG (beta-lactamase superfamily)
MKIQQLRNATLLLTLGEHRLLVDPMLSDPGTIPGFKMFGGGRRRNPLVPLPAQAAAALASATAVVLTHEHPDHFDRAGLRWVKERALPVWGNAMDVANLARKGLAVTELVDGSMGMQVETVRSRHGRGAVGFLMGPVAGYYLAAEGEPSVYLVGDSVLTDSVMEAVTRLQPDVIVAPAGSANMGLGGNILFSVDELVELTRAARGKVVLNHLEALDHCPTTRAGLRARMVEEGLGDRVLVPEDGQELTFERPASVTRVPPAAPSGERPGMQKWMTAFFAGT